MPDNKNDILEPNDITLELDTEKQKLAEQESIKKKIEEQETKNKEREDLIKKINKEKDAEIKELKEKKIKDDTIEKVIEEIKTEHIKRVWWRSFLGIFIKKYKIEAEKIKLARIIFSKSQNNKKTKKDDEDIWNKIQEYAKKSSEITKKAPKSEILEQAGQTKQAKSGAEEKTRNQDKEKTREQNNGVKTRQT